LAALHSDLTERLIFNAALQLLEQGDTELTMRAVARQAGISERTIFRYFATRDEFLDAVAREFTRELGMPPAPESMEQILAMPRRMFETLESKSNLVKSSLRSDIFPRMWGGVAHQRWIGIRKALEKWAPHADERRRKIAAANIRYFLSGTTWHYYRFVFRFSLEETIEAAETAIRQALDELKT
jgi:AcrR family transcriptional regulator